MKVQMANEGSQSGVEQTMQRLITELGIKGDDEHMRTVSEGKQAGGRGKGHELDSFGFKKKLPTNMSLAVKAAQEARKAAASVENALWQVGAGALIAALLWAAVWAFSSSDYVLGRLGEIHVPLSMRLMQLSDASAQTQGSHEFRAMADIVIGWSQGWLVKGLAIMVFVSGMGVALVRQAIPAAVVAIATALVLLEGPSLIGQVAGPATAQGGTAVQVFERNGDLEALRAGLAKQQFSPHLVSYVLGQAIVMESDGRGLNQQRRAELLRHIDVVRQALARGTFVDGKPHPVYAMEVAGYGKGSTGEAAGIENIATMARTIAGGLTYVGGFVFGLVAICGVLALVLLGRVLHARSVEEAADPVAQEQAAQTLRQALVRNANQVPFVDTSNSSGIERLIRGIELSGVMAAKRASGG